MGPWTRTYRLLMPALMLYDHCSGRRTQDHSVRCSGCRRSLLGHRRVCCPSAARANHLGSIDTPAGAPLRALSGHCGHRVPHCCSSTARRLSLPHFPLQLHCNGSSVNVAATAGLGWAESPMLAGEAGQIGAKILGRYENNVCVCSTVPRIHQVKSVGDRHCYTSQHQPTPNTRNALKQQSTH